MNESKHPGLKLFHWVDAMKTMGMFFIIYGHLFSYGYSYVYAFNVPVFFILSGFVLTIAYNGRLNSLTLREETCFVKKRIRKIYPL